MPTFNKLSRVSRVRRVALLLAIATVIMTAAGMSLENPPALQQQGSTEQQTGADTVSDESSRSRASLHVLQNLARASTTIAIGRVEETEATWTGTHGLPGIHTAVSLRVEMLIKGEGGESVAFWVQGGVIDRHARRVVGQAHFTPGEYVL